ncbi:MAG: biotin--[acetyl-CoA-carboxylase] ligase [Coriobacteriia bacterium]|nr:biotin--[acetyl-CoA-carboxylase] ligase [Coriobacteriia bacterium]
MSRRADVLAALRDAAAAGVSGEALAGRFLVSRAAVGKHVAALRELGYDIAAVPGSGYRLVSAPELPLPDEVAGLVREPLWRRFEGGIETDSTNDDAKVLARAGAEAGTVVLAARQRAGRGRLGRTWESPHGGLYLSAILRPDVGIADISPLSLVAGIGVARALERLGADTGLKWPNDVWSAAGGKIAGILLEVSAEADRVEWVVAGIGINISAPDGRADGAAYLDEIAPVETDDPMGPPGAPPRLARVAAIVLDGVAGVVSEWESGGFASLLGEYERRSVLTGRDVTVRDAGGQVRASGTVRGTDASGRLLVATASGEVAVPAGDVTLREPGD